MLLLLFHTGRYAGLGTNLISSVFSGNEINSYDWLLKLLLTVLTLAAGFQGGEVTPLFAIGATLGATLAAIFGLPVMLVAALGYAAVFGSATKTLFAPMLIGAEVFGPQNIIYFAIVCSIAYVISGKHTIYGAQVKFNYLDSHK
jgi:H+/Cl- antiporter ClcA